MQTIKKGQVIKLTPYSNLEEKSLLTKILFSC